MAGFLSRVQAVWRSLAGQSNSRISQRFPTAKKILFYRDFLGLTGGHLKVWHYFNHVRYSPDYQPLIAFSADTVWNDANPWLPLRDQILTDWKIDLADILLLAGMDWTLLSESQRHSPPKPIINLIQHVRHADPQEPLYQFLEHRAVRICVSEPVAEALRTTERVNGPLFTISNGIDLAELPACKAWETRDFDLLILGIKQPALAMKLAETLRATSYRISTLTAPLPRSAFLELLANTRVSLFLPHRTEGFYLPALEGFALGTVVICPDCIGNRVFCRAGENCFQPSYHEKALLEACQQALHLASLDRLTLLDSAQRTAQRHSLAQERQSFLALLERMESFWSGTDLHKNQYSIS